MQSTALAPFLYVVEKHCAKYQQDNKLIEKIKGDNSKCHLLEDAENHMTLVQLQSRDSIILLKQSSSSECITRTLLIRRVWKFQRVWHGLGTAFAQNSRKRLFLLVETEKNNENLEMLVKNKSHNWDMVT